MSKFTKYFSVIFIVASLAACQAGDDPEEEPKDSCSNIGLDTKILNGTSCIEGSSPVVSLELTIDVDGVAQVGLCTGSMVTSDTVVTAAHCFESGEVLEVVATGGPVGIGSQRSVASSVIVHPAYNVAVDGTLKNDVAIVKLAAPLNLPTFPVIISHTLEEGDQLDIYGFGQDDDEKAGFLKSGSLHIDDISQDNIFAVFDDTSSSVCFGDSGGPATYDADVDGKSVVGLVGLTSTGQPDPDDENPSACQDGQLASFTNLLNPEVLNFLRDNVPGLALR